MRRAGASGRQVRTRHPVGSLRTVLAVGLRGANGVAAPDLVASTLGRHLDVTTGAADAGPRLIGPDVVTVVVPAPERAVRAAIALFRSLGGDGSPPLAAAVHTGAATSNLTEGAADPTVQRAVDIVEATPTGQILISGDAATAHTLQEASLERLGMHRLRDLGVPVALWRVSHPDLPAGGRSPPDTLERIEHNLPLQPTRFVGRDEIIHGLVERLGRTRLLTVTGPGGVGKTRLALQAAAVLAGRPFEEVRFESLADVTDPDRVGITMASALGAPGEPGLSPVDRIAHLFKDGEVLLVLDNCEHVLDAAATFAAELLAACTRLRVLATSRQPLAVPGETVWNLVGLPTPASIETASEDELRRSEPVQLFLDRAEDADAQIRPDGVDDLRTITRICRRLDGLPLAIELAAARVRTLSLRDIETQLEGRVDLLADGPRTAPGRHRTLDRTIAWSCDLLDDEERRLFDRLGIFNSPVEAEAIAQVCAADESDSDVLELLTSLVDRSLVVAERDEVRTTYRQLDTIRSYARKRLDLHDARLLADAHMSWVAGFCLAAGEQLDGPEQAGVISRVTARLEDIRAAVAHAPETGAVREVLVAITALVRYWYIRDCRTGAEMLDRLRGNIELSHLPPDIDATVRYASGSLRERLGETRAAAIDHARSVERFEEAGDQRSLANALIALARARWDQAGTAEIRDLLERALHLAEELGDEPTGEGHALLFLMILADEEGDTERVVDLARRCRGPLERSTPDLRAHGIEIAGYGEVRAGRHAEAWPLLLEAIETYARNQALSCGAHAMLTTARCLQLTGRQEEAARLYGASEEFRRQIELPTPRYERFLLDPLREELRAEFDAETLEAVCTEGAALGFDGAMAYARRLLSGDPAEVTGPGRSRRFYRILGPVAATVDGVEIDLGPAKQRKLLARLVVAEGDPVSIDQLVQAVWGEQAPAKPRVSLQSYISRLRGLLALPGDDREAILTVGEHYTLEFDDADLDLYLAERSVTEGRGAHDPAVAADRWQHALGWWRGRVADDLEELPDVVPFRVRAQELRRQLAVCRAEALAGIGRGSEVIAELQPLAEEHPYDEQIEAVLLRALAAQGRHGDALSRYERFRRRLAEELGADPTPALRELHVALLGHRTGASDEPAS